MVEMSTTEHTPNTTASGGTDGRRRPLTCVKNQRNGPRGRPQVRVGKHGAPAPCEKAMAAASGFDAHGGYPIRVKNRKRGTEDYQTLKVATWNVDSLTGRSAEIVKAMRDRKLDICCLQETRWKGNKATTVDGYKIIYTSCKENRGGVAVVVSPSWQSSVAEVTRLTERLMTIVVVTERQRLHILSAYAPQTGCHEEEKDAFWELLDTQLRQIPHEDDIIISGDLNGHVGRDKNGHQCHGGHGTGDTNENGQRILDFADSHDMTITNTCFIRRESQLLTYHSRNGSHHTQIDYIIVRRRAAKNVLNAKVYPYESSSQHRPLMAKIRISKPKTKIDKRNADEPRIKWWNQKKMTGPLIKPEQFLQMVDEPQEAWSMLKSTVHTAGCQQLGRTKPGRRRIERDTWLWTPLVQDAVHLKKRLYKAFLQDKTSEKLREYKAAKKTAKKAVATARSSHYDDIYNKLNTREGENEIYRLAKRRHRKTLDIDQFHGINDERGNLIVNPRDAAERWRQYFEKISTEEFPHPRTPRGDPVEGPVPDVHASEVTDAIKAMKNGKATGPDDIPADFWKKALPGSALWLCELFNKIVSTGKVPHDWYRSTTVPIWKGKGSPADCSNYRPIRLLSHTMKIFERVLDKRIRDIVDISVNQAGFIKNCGTTDAIFGVRMLMEAHREKKIPLHTAFLDLEKAFDRVPHDLIWYALRDQGVPEQLVQCVQLLYRCHKSRVKAAAGISEEFNITVGVHQGSALSPLLFILVMDTITRDLHTHAPWTLLYADDVFLASLCKAELEHLVQQWHDRLEQFGLRLNLKKTEYLTTDNEATGSIHVNGQELPRASTFKYLGTTLGEEGLLQTEVAARINAAWGKWKSVTGVLCDKKMPMRLKAKTYNSVVRPVAIYGAECWPTTKEVESRLQSMEMRMLRWSAGLTLLDRVRNEEVRRRFNVVPISTVMRQSRLRWFGHVGRAKEGSIIKSAMEVTVGGARPRGRPKQRWMNTIKADLEIAKADPTHVADREVWKQYSRTLADLARARDKR